MFKQSQLVYTFTLEERVLMSCSPLDENILTVARYFINLYWQHLEECLVS